MADINKENVPPEVKSSISKEQLLKEIEKKAKNIAVLSIVVGAISFIVGIISRLIVKPFFGLESRAFASFTAICLLFAIAILLLEKKDRG